MDATTARAILAEVAAGGWLEQELPEDEDELIQLAQFYVEEATLAATEDGLGNNEHINAIIGLGRAGVTTSPPVLSETAEHTNDGVPPGEIEYVGDDPVDVFERSFEKVPEEIAKTYPRRSSGGFSESDLREYDGFPVPQALPETELDMPYDLTEVGDKPLRRLYSAFNSYHGRARWKLATASSNLANATHLRDEAYRVEYINARRQGKLAEEKYTLNDLDTMAKNSDAYKEWDERVEQHNSEVASWRALTEIYGKNVEIISREWTMRTEQYERER